MNYYVKLIILIILFIFIFYILNYILRKKEHMSMRNHRLNNVLDKYNISIDKDNFNLYQNGKIIKNYPTSHFNSMESHYLAKDKIKTNKLLLENNIPVPNHYIINKNNKEIYLNNNKIGFPCVLKPINGMQGKDVYTFIENQEEFNKILNELLEKYDEIMMENQIYGNNYRIFIFNNKVMDIIEREQPYVIGNGHTSLEELIQNKNDNQLKNNLFPTKNLDWKFMNKQGFSKNSIVPDKKKIFITNTINFHNGANPTRIPIYKIPEENLDMFVKAHKLLNLSCSGVDYMSNDIKIPYKKNKGSIIELNSSVDTKIHIDADNKEKSNLLFENIAKSLIY